MTNLEAKQEAIKKAYGELKLPFNEKILYDNGWKKIKPNQYSSKYDKVDLLKLTPNIHSIRPKSLQGIENNNGWIRIEREADLPNDEDAIYWALKNSKVVCIELKTPINLKELFSDFLKDKITHYQLIEKPKPPIF